MPALQRIIINTTILAAACSGSKINGNCLPHVDTANNSGTIATVMSIALGVAGALALLMITISGLRYITSAGNPEKTSRAKNGIIYSLVGLVIAVTAEGIVLFIAHRL